MRKGTRAETSAHVAADPDAVYALVSDVTRMGQWSPECVACEWADGATGPAVGARFRGRNRHGLARWSTTPTVVAAEPGREFAFVVPDLLGRDSTRWSYRLEPDGGGTLVTEAFELLKDQPLAYRLTERVVMRVKDRRSDLEANMGVTLGNLKRAAEAT